MYLLTSFTKQGIKTPANQDVALARTWALAGGQLALLALADGMGGYAEGQHSATAVIKEIGLCCDKVLALEPAEPLDVLSRELDDAIKLADEKIKYYCAAMGIESGTTVVLAVLFRGQYMVKNIGDSRAFLVRRNKLRQLNEDHTLMQQEIKAGRLTPQQAAKHPQRHVLSHCVGLGKYEPPFTTRGFCEKEDVMFLCSDGFYRRTKHTEMVKAAHKWAAEGDNAFEELVPVLRGRGEADDITVTAALVQTKQPKQEGGTGWQKLHNEMRTDRKRRITAGVLIALSVAALAAIVILFFRGTWL